MHFTPAIFILTLLQTEAAPPVKGKLCFADGACQATSGTSISVSADETPRRFVWRSENSRTVVIGELPLKETVIELDLQPQAADEESSSGQRSVRFKLRGDAGRGWPAAADIQLSRSREQRWEWAVPAAAQGEEITVHLPEGGYEMWIVAPRHQAERRRLRLERDLRLGEITLKPVPVISGRVTRLEGEEIRPVEGAQLMLESGSVATSTNEQGAFQTELVEPLPKELLVVSPGLASRVILFDKLLKADNDLGEIRLESGASLTLNIERSDELRAKPLRVGLLRKNERRYEHSRIGDRELGAGDDTVQFTDLPEGRYLVLIEGKEELERMVVPVELEKENVAREIEVRPYRLNGTVRVGDEAPDEGHVEVQPSAQGSTWRAKLPIDSEGNFGGVLWQPGLLSGFVKLPDSSGGLLMAQSPELGSDPSNWPIRFKKRLIHGRVTDAATGEPVGSVSLRLETTTGGRRGYTTLKVAPSGDYEILAWEDGTYDLTFNAENYLPETTTVELGQDHGSRRIDIALDGGIETVLEFVWPTGQPVANAPVLEGLARDGHNPRQHYSTDAAGRLKLRMKEGPSRLLYIIPKEGSFAPVRVSGAKSDQPRRFEVPAPVGVLRVRLIDGEEDAPGRGAIVMRYNGEWVPYPVTGRLRVSYLPGMTEFSALPAGAYDVWAVQRGAGGPTAPHTPPAHPPVSTGVAAGETTIEVKVVKSDG